MTTEPFPPPPTLGKTYRKTVEQIYAEINQIYKDNWYTDRDISADRSHQDCLLAIAEYIAKR